MQGEIEPEDEIKEQTFDQVGFTESDSFGIYPSRKAFELSYDDYLILTKTKSRLSDWSNNLFICGVTLLIFVLAKYLANIVFIQSVQIYNWEIIATGIAIGCAILLKGANCIWPDEKKRLLKNMNNHFRTTPKHRFIKKNERRKA